MLPLVRRKRRKESGWEREVVKRQRCAEGRHRAPGRTRGKHMAAKEVRSREGKKARGRTSEREREGERERVIKKERGERSEGTVVAQAGKNERARFERRSAARVSSSRALVSPTSRGFASLSFATRRSRTSLTLHEESPIFSLRSGASFISVFLFSPFSFTFRCNCARTTACFVSPQFFNRAHSPYSLSRDRAFGNRC